MTSRNGAARGRYNTVFLTGTLAFLFGTTGLCSAAVEPTSSDKYTVEAQDYARKGDLPAAIIQLKNALRDNSDNGQARLDLSKLYIQSGDYQSAMRELETLRTRGFDEAKIILPLGECYFVLGRYSDVVKIDPAKLAPADRASGYALQARAYISLKNPTNARTAIDAALKENPQDPSGLFASAVLLRSQNKITEAEADVDKAIKSGATRPDIMVLKGELRRDQKDDAGAMKAFNAVVEKSPNDRAARLGRAMTNIMFKRPNDAKADINAVLTIDPKNALALYLSAYTLNQDHRYADAIQTLNSAPELLDKYPPALYLMAASAMSANQLEVAMKSAAAYNAQVPGDVGGVKLLAELNQRLNMPAKSISLLEPLTTQYPDDTQLKLQLANAYLAAGRSQEAVTLFQQGLASDPKNDQARLSLALGELRSGATDAGIAQLETVLQTKPTSLEANAALILAAVQSNNAPKALETANALVKADPNNPNAYNLLGTAQIAGHDANGARATFMTALQKDPKFTPAMLNLAELENMTGNRPAAKQWYEKVVAVEPKSTKAYEKLAELSFKDNQPQQAVAYLERGITQDPNAIEIRLALIDLHLQMKENSQALIAARATADALPNNPQALDALARTQLVTADYVNAIGTYEQLAARFPENVEVQHRLARTMMQTAQSSHGDSASYWNQARGVLDKALAMAPDNLMIINDRIEVEAKISGNAGAVTLAQKLSTDRPQSTERLISLGTMQTTAGNLNGALESYRAAWKQKESGLTALRLYESLIQTHHTDEALAFMKTWADRNPADNNARFVLASQYIAMGKNEDALRETEVLHRALPHNPIVLNNLAWLNADKDKAQAIKYGEQAYAISPQSADVMDTLGWLYVASGDTAKGEAMLGKAYAAAPAQPGIAYRYAAALEKSGHAPQARTVLTKLLATNAPFSERQEAQTLLTKIGS